MAQEAHGLGIGRVLYSALFELLRLQGFVTVFAGVALPNEASEGLHHALGFAELGLFRNVGFKLNRWHDTRWFQLQLQEVLPEQPSDPVLFPNLESVLVEEILRKANRVLQQRIS